MLNGLFYRTKNFGKRILKRSILKLRFYLIYFQCTIVHGTILFKIVNDIVLDLSLNL
jgi:hypothetical protein